MEPVVIACGGCGAAIRIRHPEIARRRVCPRRHAHLTRDQYPVCRQSLPQQATSAPEPTADQTERQQSSRTRHVPREGKLMARLASILIAALLLGTGAWNGDQAAAQPQRAVPVLAKLVAAPAAGPAQAPPEPPRFKVRDEQGQPVVARLHGQHEGTTALILPDGQLGIPNMLVPTNEPFQPFTAEELLERLQKGPLGDFQVHQTAHYLIFYQSSRGFAEASCRWLEDLYRRLLDAFRKHEMAAHDTEFPLVAVIYGTERDFRASKRVDPEVQADYEIYTNRIYFYETSGQDENAPEVSALRKPQTVVHEGTHQVLQNIGVHPRLSAWPIWLVEGLAEYCSTPTSSRKGGKPTWDGLG